MEFDVKSIVAIAALFISTVGSIFTFISTRAAAKKKEFEQIKSELDALQREHTRMKSRLDNMPNSKEFNDLKVSLVELAGEMKAMDEKITPIATTANRVEQFLIDLGKDKK